MDLWVESQAMDQEMTFIWPAAEARVDISMGPPRGLRGIDWREKYFCVILYHFQIMSFSIG